MEELIEKVNELKLELDNTKEIKELKSINEEIMKDKDLLNDIKLFNETQDNSIKERIINNKLFREYKHKENEVNFIILEINKKLKEINNRNKGCM
jgi:cell fate (sporulation/competence/biofilm development) regulator YmcA (YheA/YmcA/DUF963 family)